MTLSKSFALLVLAAGLFGAPLPTGAPTTPDPLTDDEFTLNLSGGLPIDRLLEDYAEITGRRVVWDARRLGAKVITGTGDMTFPRSQAERVFGSILSMHDMAILPHGPEDLGFVLIEDTKTSNLLKQHASHVDVGALPEVGPGRIVTVVFPLKHVSAERAQRVLNNFIQDHRSGFVAPMEESNALVLTNFAPAVSMMVSVLTELEQAATTDEAKAFRQLREKMKSRKEK